MRAVCPCASLEMMRTVPDMPANAVFNILFSRPKLSRKEYGQICGQFAPQAGMSCAYLQSSKSTRELRVYNWEKGKAK